MIRKISILIVFVSLLLINIEIKIAHGQSQNTCGEPVTSSRVEGRLRGEWGMSYQLNCNNKTYRVQVFLGYRVEITPQGGNRACVVQIDNYYSLKQIYSGVSNYCNQYELFKPQEEDDGDIILNTLKQLQAIEEVNRINGITRTLTDQSQQRFTQELDTSTIPTIQPDPCRKYSINILGVEAPNPTHLFQWLGCKLITGILKIGVGVLNFFIGILAKIIKNIAFLAFHIVGVWFNFFVVPLVDIASSLNPFDGSLGENTPAFIVWRTLRDLSYIVLVFVALYTAFVWLQEGMSGATPIIFNILLVALFINFTYAFVQLGWNISFNIQQGITFRMPLGQGIAAAFWSADPLGTWSEEMEKLQINFEVNTNNVASIIGESNESGDNEDMEIFVSSLMSEINRALVDAFAELGKTVFPLALLIFLSIILLSLVVFFILRYVYIIFLAGVSPFAILSLAIPSSKKGGLAGIIPTIFGGISSEWFSKWIGKLSEWLVNAPLIIIFLILGIVIQQNFVFRIGSSPTTSAPDFILGFIFMTVWFLFSWKLVISSTGKLGQTVGILGTTLPWFLTRKMGDWIMRRSGVYKWTGDRLRDLSGLIQRGTFVNSVPVFGGVVRSLASGLETASRRIGSLYEPSSEKARGIASHLKASYLEPLKRTNQLNVKTRIINDFLRNSLLRSMVGENAQREMREVMKDISFSDALLLINQANTMNRLEEISAFLEGDIKMVADTLKRRNISTDDLQNLIIKLDEEKFYRVYENFRNLNWEEALRRFFLEGLARKNILEKILLVARTDMSRSSPLSLFSSFRNVWQTLDPKLQAELRSDDDLLPLLAALT